MESIPNTTANIINLKVKTPLSSLKPFNHTMYRM